MFVSKPFRVFTVYRIKTFNFTIIYICLFIIEIESMPLFHKQFDVTTAIGYDEISSCGNRCSIPIPHKMQPPPNISLEFVVGFYRKQCQETVKEENQSKKNPYNG